jgi:uncharacterized membrane protein
MQEIIISYFSTFPKEWAVFFLSMIPVTELRATIPLGIVKFEMVPIATYFYAVLGNTLMGSLVVLVVEPIAQYAFAKIGFLHRFWLKYINRITNKNKAKFDKWGSLALIIFIAIPLPMTGAFSGGVLASIFGVPFKKAAINILAGCSIAGIIVTGITLGARGIM